MIVVTIFQGLGDIVLTTPALRAIRKAMPEATLMVAGPAGVIGILEHEAYIDGLLPLRHPVGLTDLRAALESIWRIRALHPDKLIDLTTPLHPHTWLKSQLLLRACVGSARRLGPMLTDVMTWSFRREAVPYRHKVHESQLKLEYLKDLLGPLSWEPPSLAHAQGILPKSFPPRSGRARIGVAPGGARPSRQWPPVRMAETLREVLRQVPAEILIFGSRAERKLSGSLREKLRPYPATDLAGALDISALPSAIAELDVLLANDSGPMHVAAAVGTPLVAILGPELLSRYAPLGDPSRIALFHRPYPCSPCLRRTCSHQSCLSWIEPKIVARAIRKFMHWREAAVPLANQPDRVSL